MKRNPIPPRNPRVQLNVGIPWELRKHLVDIAADKRMSLSELVRTALEAQYSQELSDKEKEWIKTQTRGAGATT